MTVLAVIVIATLGFIIAKKSGWIDSDALIYENPYLSIWVGNDYGLGIWYTQSNKVITILLGFIDICIYVGG